MTQDESGDKTEIEGKNLSTLAKTLVILPEESQTRYFAEISVHKKSSWKFLLWLSSKFCFHLEI